MAYLQNDTTIPIPNTKPTKPYIDDVMYHVKKAIKLKDKYTTGNLRKKLFLNKEFDITTQLCFIFYDAICNKHIVINSSDEAKDYQEKLIKSERENNTLEKQNIKLQKDMDVMETKAKEVGTAEGPLAQLDKPTAPDGEEDRRFKTDKEDFVVYAYKKKPKKMGDKVYTEVYPKLYLNTPGGVTQCEKDISWLKGKGYLKEADASDMPQKSDVPLADSALNNL